jgi:hypothetical protein
MIVSLGNNNVGNDIVKVSNVFDEDFINFLYDDCQNQLKYNLLSDNYILSSKGIIDCHGLVICNNKQIKQDPEFPYSIRNWNLFCIKMQNIMFDYCDKFELNKGNITPHSCWVERSLIVKLPYIEAPIDDTDVWLDAFCNNSHPLTHYRIVYFLKNPCSEFGLIICDKDKKFNLLGEENSLYILPTGKYNCYTKFSTTIEEQFVLMFDWYLHPDNSTEDPTWTFPNKYNRKLLKKYIKILKKKLPQK